MSTSVLEELKTKVTNLTDSERMEFAEFMQRISSGNLKTGKGAPKPPDDEKLQRQNWINANRTKYSGYYVALVGDRFIGSGNTFREARTIAVNAGFENAFIDFIAPENYAGELGIV